MCNGVADKFHIVVLHGETLVFVTTAIAATVAEVESGSTFGETCLATEVQKVSRNQLRYTVQRLLKHVSQRRCTQVSSKLEVSTCNSGLTLLKAEISVFFFFRSLILMHLVENCSTKYTFLDISPNVSEN